MPHATPADLLLRFDARRIGQLAADDGTKLTSAQIASDPVVLEALADATAVINSAALRGERYTEDDLSGLAAADAKLLIRLTCEVAYQMLVQRRGNLGTSEQSGPGYGWAMATLEQLSNGDRVFNVPGNLEAGLPKRAVLDRNLQLISSATRHYGDLVVNPANPGTPRSFE